MWKGDRSTASYKGKPIPRQIRTLDGFWRYVKKPEQVVKDGGEGAMYPFTREFPHPNEPTRAAGAGRRTRRGSPSTHTTRGVSYGGAMNGEPPRHPRGHRPTGAPHPRSARTTWTILATRGRRG